MWRLLLISVFTSFILLLFMDGAVHAHPQNGKWAPLDLYDIATSASGYHLKSKHAYFLVVEEDGICRVHIADYDGETEKFIIKEEVSLDDNKQFFFGKGEGLRIFWRFTLIEELDDLSRIRPETNSPGHLNDISGCYLVWEEIKRKRKAVP